MVKTGVLCGNWGVVAARVGLGHDEAPSILAPEGAVVAGKRSSTPQEAFLPCLANLWSPPGLLHEPYSSSSFGYPALPPLYSQTTGPDSR